MSSTVMTSQEAQASTLLDELAALRKDLSSSEASTRKDIVAKAQALITALETPMEWTLRTMLAEVSDFTTST